MTETTTDRHAGIVPEHILAVQAIYFAYVLEELRVFQVVDRLAQRFSQGLLPIGTPATRDALIAIAFSTESMTEQDRRSLYARALGAGGEAGRAEPNHEFLPLWLRFVSAVSAYAERQPADHVLAPPSAANAGVRRSAQDLALNASSNGDGLTRRMAQQLLAEVHARIDLLGSADVLEAYGARDAWQVIELVNRSELGGARDVERYRAQAVAGSRILRWLAEHSDVLDDAKAATLAATPEAPLLVEAAEQLLVASSGVPAEDDSGGEGPRDRASFAPGATRRRVLASIGNAASAVVTVFNGDRHTGKTIAVYLLAEALGKDVHRVDLAGVTSKYIGETEKNLDAVFRRAEEAGAVLLFEEADALFGKRTDVRDAHDRYANIDTGDLLQRMERHVAPVVLTTNRKQNIDPAFLRRVRLVDFPR